METIALTSMIRARKVFRALRRGRAKVGTSRKAAGRALRVEAGARAVARVRTPRMAVSHVPVPGPVVDLDLVTSSRKGSARMEGSADFLILRTRPK